MNTADLSSPLAAVLKFRVVTGRQRSVEIRIIQAHAKTATDDDGWIDVGVLTAAVVQQPSLLYIYHMLFVSDTSPSSQPRLQKVFDSQPFCV